MKIDWVESGDSGDVHSWLADGSRPDRIFNTLDFNKDAIGKLAARKAFSRNFASARKRKSAK